METTDRWTTINRWNDKENVIYTHSGVLHRLSKEERNPAFCKNTNGSGRYYVKWNKPDTERQILGNLK